MDGSDTASGRLCSLFIANVQDYAIVMLSPHGRVLTWNAGAQRIKGYVARDIIGRSFEVFFTPEDAARGTPQRHLADAAALGHLKHEGWRVRADGSQFWADVVLTAIYDRQHQLLGFGKITRDITEGRRFQQELMRRALHDPLTGLPNRVLLLDRLGKALARLQRHPGILAVFFIDLDRFKAINDTLGHHGGDHVLITVAERMRAALRAQDTVARLSGDEFVVLCEGLCADLTAARIGERLAAALTPPIRAGDGHLQIEASIGVAVTDHAETEAEALLQDADAAMYQAKRQVGGDRIRIRLYDDAMQQ